MIRRIHSTRPEDAKNISRCHGSINAVLAGVRLASGLSVWHEFHCFEVPLLVRGYVTSSSVPAQTHKSVPSAEWSASLPDVRRND